MRIAVIGSGFSGLASSTVLAASGHEVTVYEKNTTAGGRARKFEAQGLTFDMGPSWYWMPDVFERYFNLFGKTTSDWIHPTESTMARRISWTLLQVRNT